MTLRDATLEHAGQSPVDHHYRIAGAGIAPTAHLEPQELAGDPTPFEPPIHVAVTELQPEAHDGGPTCSETLASVAAVTLSDPAITAVRPDNASPDRGAAQTMPGVHMIRGGSTLSEPALAVLEPSQTTPARGDGPCGTETHFPVAVASPSDLAIQELNPSDVREDRGGGLDSSGSQTGSAPAKPSLRANAHASPTLTLPGEGDGLVEGETHASSAVATIVDLWRQRVDLKRAAGRLNLQALAVCRRAHGGDKDAAQKAWGLVQKGQGDKTLSMVVEPYRQAMVGLEASAHALEKQLTKLVRKQPLWAWAVDVRGLGEISLAGLIGEASGNLGDYKSVSALWKRMGLAVIDGERQRRVATAEAALRHGYAPQRRAFAYVISCNLMKSQRAEDEYRQLYDRRKAYELEREIPKAHAHNRALRVMVKELLKDAWAADRRLRRVPV